MLLPLFLTVDGEPDGTLLATRGPEDGWLTFRQPMRLRWQDGRIHEIALHMAEGETAIGRLTAEIRQQRHYRDAEGLLEWAYHHRILSAPFGEVDRICLAFWDQEADCLAARQRPSPSEAPLVSVVMPTFNAAKLLPAAIRSVQAQQVTDWELLIIDDGSVDETDAVFDQFNDPRIEPLRLPSNLGLGAVRQIGLERARGRFIAYLDTDNHWDPRFLAVMVSELLVAPEWDSVYCAQYLLRPGADGPSALRTGAFNPALITNQNFIDINCFVHRREAALNAGGFDPACRWMEDWDIVLRMTAHQPPRFVPAPLSWYRLNWPSASLEAKQKRGWNLMVGRRNLMPGAFSPIPRHPSGAAIFGSSPMAARSAEGVSIVIPSFEVPEVLALCIDRLFATIDPMKVEVILCDGSVSPNMRELILGLQTAHPTLHVKWLEQNLGFSVSANRGIEHAIPGNHIVLLNNDAIVTPGWLEALVALADEPNVGAVVPRQVLLPGTPTISEHAPAANPHLEIDVNLSAHHANVLTGLSPRRDGAVEIKFAPFFCILLTRAALAALPRLDARRGRHDRSDRLYCMAMRGRANLRMLYTPHAKVYHLLRQSSEVLKAVDPEAYSLICSGDRWEGQVEPWDV